MRIRQDQPITASVLLVDDNEHGLVARKNVLQQNGYETTTATSAEAGLTLIDSQSFDLVVTDYKMGGMNGVEFIALLRAQRPEIKVILLSGFVGALGLNEKSSGADAVLEKSANEAATLVRTVARLLNRSARKPPKKETGVPRALRKTAP